MALKTFKDLIKPISLCSKLCNLYKTKQYAYSSGVSKYCRSLSLISLLCIAKLSSIGTFYKMINILVFLRLSKIMYCSIKYYPQDTNTLYYDYDH